MSEVGECDTEGMDVNEIVKENEVLLANLSKCMEEKNFLWSLWKKLQTEKPDLSSVVSLITAREKEKNEIRDAKVLNILKIKDSQIQQLERDKEVLDGNFKKKEEELEAYSLRLHDLLIEKAELQEKVDSVKIKYAEEMKSLVEENRYLSEIVRARQVKYENDENAYKIKLDDVDREKQELHHVVKDLEHRVDKLNEEKIIDSAVVEENMNMKNQLNVLQEQLKHLKQEHEDGMTTLRLRERQLQQHSNVNQENKQLLNEKEKLLNNLRQELNDLKSVHGHCGDYENEQSTLIQKLQSLQDETQTVIKAQEEKFRSEVIDLKEQLKDSIKLRQILKEDLDKSKLQDCKACVSLKEELKSVKIRNDELLETTQEKNRRISSLEKTLVANDSYRKSGNYSPNKTLEKKFKLSEKKIFELQKVLEFKQNELDAVNAAHSNRFQRFKNLQHEHKIVLEQLKTYGNYSEDEAMNHVEEQSVRRASPRSLQKEDSDSVWNELQYFKTEYEKLRNERDGVMEEIDALRVEHSNDVTTIHELRMCIEDEKREIAEQIQTNNAQKNDDIKQENRQLQNEKNELILQLGKVKNDCCTTQDEKETLKKSLSEQEQVVKRLAGEISKYKKDLKLMKDESDKTKDKKNKTTQVYETSFEERRRSISSEKQVQTETSFQKQLHEATKQLILDASETHNTQQHKTCHRDAQTSPIQTFAEPSFFIAHPSHGDSTAKVDDSLPTRDESLSKDLGEKSGDHYLSSRSVIESPAKRARTKAKSPVNREWRSMRRRVSSLTQQVAGLKTAKESLTKSLNEIKLSNERLQNDLSQSQQRARVSKLTIERLTNELQQSRRQHQALIKNAKEYKVPSYPTEKHLEDRLKLSANECSRLSHELKSARKTNEELLEKLKSLQEKSSRLEQALNQKKVFVEEMKSRLKVTLSNLESTQESLQQSEEKVRLLTEKESQRKNQMDSLKYRLETEINEKKRIGKIYNHGQEELKRKAKLLTQAQALRHEAETAVNEMEEAAKTQLNNLANQSQVTLCAIEQQLSKSRQRLDEFQIVVRTLTQKLTDQITNKRLEIKQEQFQKFEEEKKTTSMVQACELASSILNMSKADIDELLDVDLYENDDNPMRDQVGEWGVHLEEILSNEESFAVPLVQLFLGIVENLVKLEKVFAEGGENHRR